MEKNFYTTDSLTVSAVILASIPGSEAKIVENDSPRKTFRITYLSQYKVELLLLLDEYSKHTARVNVFAYCKKLNLLRDLLNGRAAL